MIPFFKRYPLLVPFLVLTLALTASARAHRRPRGVFLDTDSVCVCSVYATLDKEPLSVTATTAPAPTCYPPVLFTGTTVDSPILHHLTPIPRGPTR